MFSATVGEQIVAVRHGEFRLEIAIGTSPFGTGPFSFVDSFRDGRFYARTHPAVGDVDVRVVCDYSAIVSHVAYPGDLLDLLGRVHVEGAPAAFSFLGGLLSSSGWVQWARGGLAIESVRAVADFVAVASRDNYRSLGWHDE